MDERNLRLEGNDSFRDMQTDFIVLFRSGNNMKSVTSLKGGDLLRQFKEAKEQKKELEIPVKAVNPKAIWEHIWLDPKDVVALSIVELEVTPQKVIDASGAVIPAASRVIQ